MHLGHRWLPLVVLVCAATGCAATPGDDESASNTGAATGESPGARGTMRVDDHACVLRSATLARDFAGGWQARAEASCASTKMVATLQGVWGPFPQSAPAVSVGLDVGPGDPALLQLDTSRSGASATITSGPAAGAHGEARLTGEAVVVGEGGETRTLSLDLVFAR